MKKWIGILITLLSASSLSAESLKMDDFAYGIPLQVDGDGAIYSLALPAEVYRHTLRTDLGDMRIFNNLGEVVPHFLQRDQLILPGKAGKIDAKLYVLPAKDKHENDKEFHIAINKDSALINFSGGKLQQQVDTSGEHYLIDAREVDATIDGLSLEWDGETESVLAQVTVHGSNDLNRWQALVVNRTIADLRHEGFKLEQNSIDLPAKRMKYYRIHWPPGSQGIPLRRVELQLRSKQIALQGQKVLITPTGDIDSDGNYDFKLDGHFPISGVRLLMPQRNTAAHSRLYSRTNAESPWQMRYQGLFYDLEREGHRLQSEPVHISLLSHPLWRLQVPQSSGGLGRGVPQLELEWRPHRLHFVARGDTPFTLAFGRQQTDANVAAINPLLNRVDKEAHFIKPAITGQMFVLGGEARLQAVAPPLPWKKWLLWIVLLCGVAILALMVRSLYQQMNRDEPLL